MSKPKRTRQARADISCKSITDLIWKYTSDRLDPNLKRAFEAHLRICPDCVHFLNTYKKTVSLARSLNTSSIPPKIHANLRAFLRQRIRRSTVFLLWFLNLLAA